MKGKNCMKKKGYIKIRQINKGSVGITIPKDLVEFLSLDIGMYSYNASKDGDNIQLILMNLEKIIKERK
jgi:hypothetical protein